MSIKHLGTANQNHQDKDDHTRIYVLEKALRNSESSSFLIYEVKVLVVSTYLHGSMQVCMDRYKDYTYHEVSPFSVINHM